MNYVKLGNTGMIAHLEEAVGALAVKLTQEEVTYLEFYLKAFIAFQQLPMLF